MWTCSNCQNNFDDDTILFCPDCGTKKINESEGEIELCEKCNSPMELVMMCPNCNEEVEDIAESGGDIHNVAGEDQLCPKCKSSLELMWACLKCSDKMDKVGKELCSKCNTPLDPDERFCGACGAVREDKKKRRNIMLDHAETGKTEEVPKAVAVINSPVFIPPQEVPIRDYTIFASQFPVWDLQPPDILIRRVKRSI